MMINMHCMKYKCTRNFAKLQHPARGRAATLSESRRRPAWGAPAPGWHRRGTCRGPWPPGLGLAAGAALPLAGSVPVSPGRADSVGLGRRNLTHTQLNSGRAAACKVDTVLVITSNRPTAPPAQRYGGIITTDSEAASATDSDSESETRRRSQAAALAAGQAAHSAAAAT